MINLSLLKTTMPLPGILGHW